MGQQILSEPFTYYYEQAAQYNDHKRLLGLLQPELHQLISILWIIMDQLFQSLFLQVVPLISMAQINHQHLDFGWPWSSRCGQSMPDQVRPKRQDIFPWFDDHAGAYGSGDRHPVRHCVRAQRQKHRCLGNFYHKNVGTKWVQAPTGLCSGQAWVLQISAVPKSRV